MHHGISIPSHLSNLDKVREFLLKIFEDCGLNLKYFNRVFLGLSEAVCNSIIHGNGLVDEKMVIIDVQCSSDKLVLEVSDEGLGFSLDCIQDPLCNENIKKEHGRGIFLIRNMADEVVFKDGGSKVMIKYILPQ